MPEPHGGEFVGLTRYRDDPESFVRQVLGGDPWTGQVAVLQAIRDHDRVAVRAGHGPGKTWISAGVVLWWLMTRSPAIAVTTAPTGRQVKQLLWREIRKQFRGARVGLPGDIQTQDLKIGEDHYGTGFSSDEQEKCQGFHSPNLLIVVDEASGVDEPIYTALQGALTSHGAKMLLIGNPTRPTGRFARAFKDSRWSTIHLSAFDTPNLAPYREWCRARGISLVQVAGAAPFREWTDLGRPGLRELPRPELITPSWILDELEDYGEESSVYQVQVLGDFPDAADDSLLPLSWIERSFANWEEEKAAPASLLRDEPSDGSGSLTPPPLEFGVDVARYGSCESVLCARRGGRVERLESWRKFDLMYTAGRVAAAIKAEPEVRCVKVDAIGYGGGVVDRLLELERTGELPRGKVVPITVSHAARQPERFHSLRDELWWALRDWFRTGRIAVAEDRHLKEQLSSMTYGFSSAGQIKVASKDELREKGLPSPDRADALGLAFAPLVGAPAGYAGAGVPRRGVRGVS